jgi:hypothetical protein
VLGINERTICCWKKKSGGSDMAPQKCVYQGSWRRRRPAAPTGGRSVSGLKMLQEVIWKSFTSRPRCGPWWSCVPRLSPRYPRYPSYRSCETEPAAWGVNHKSGYGLSCLDGLQKRHKAPRRRRAPSFGRIGWGGISAQPVLVHGSPT